MLLMVLGHVLQHVLPLLTTMGARESSCHPDAWRIPPSRQLSLFLHADPLHLLRTCFFGLARLAPQASLAFGTAQCMALFLAGGVGGNLLAAILGGDAYAGTSAVGASAALLGLDGALVAFQLRNGPYSMRGMEIALKRGAFTFLIACLRPALLQSGSRGDVRPFCPPIDQLAHLGGYLCGLLAGLLLAPSGKRATRNFHQAVFRQMSRHVAEGCGRTSLEVERRVLSYLRTYPENERHRALKEWKLKQRYRPEVAQTEDWPEVFERIKELVEEHSMPPKPKAEAERQKALAAASMSTSTSEADATRNLLPAATLEEEEELDEAGQRTKRKRERLRGLAEDAAWEHFGHRAAVAMPSFRLLRRAEMGDITLPMLRAGLGEPCGPRGCVCGLAPLTVRERRAIRRNRWRSLARVPRGCVCGIISIHPTALPAVPVDDSCHLLLRHRQSSSSPSSSLSARDGEHSALAPSELMQRLPS